jgi:hypothetical protein
MEKVGVLIERLFEQYRNNSSKEQLRVTTQLLLSELENKEEQDESGLHSIVSVFFPSFSNFSNKTDEQVEPIAKKDKEVKKVVTPAPEIKTEAKATDEKKQYTLFDPMVEIPTLALKQQEINETIAQQESLNDKLKSKSHREIASVLKDGPIKDLRKAIGINDQYLFINELFRGDQTMYERSIKTINSFNIYGEAELWIKRELKLKLGWNEGSEVVQLFDQLIKRRFS